MPLESITRVTEQVAGGERRRRRSVQRPQRRDRRAGTLDRRVPARHGAQRRAQPHRDRRRRYAQPPAGADVGAKSHAFPPRWKRPCPSSAASPIRCSPPRSQLAGAADDASAKTERAASASLEASDNVRDIASAADELSASVNEIDRQVAQSNTIAEQARCSEAGAHQRGGQGTGRGGRPHRRRGQAHHRHRRADQSAGAQRHHRSGARGRGRPRLRGGRRRGEGAGRPDRRATEDIGAQIAGMQRATDAFDRGDRRDRAHHPRDRRYQQRDRGGRHRAGRRHAGNRAQRGDRRRAHRRDRRGSVRVGEATARHPRQRRCGEERGRRSRPGGSRIRGQVDQFFDAAQRAKAHVSKAPGCAAASCRARPAWRRSGCRECRVADERASQASAAAAMRRAGARRPTRPHRRDCCARLDLDEHQQLPAPRDNIDLADRALQRRARMRKPLAIRRRRRGSRPKCRAGRRPTRSGAASGVGASAARLACASPASRHVLGKRQRALIDLAARPSGGGATSPTASLTETRASAARSIASTSAGRSPRSRGGATTMTISPRVSARRRSRARAAPVRRAAPPRTAWSIRGRRRPRARRDLRRDRRASRRGAAPLSNRTSVAGMRGELGDALRRAALFGGRKPSKKKRSVGRPATASAASTAEGPAPRSPRCPARVRLAHQLVAGIGDQRRAGVRHQRDRLRLRASRASSFGRASAALCS